MFVHFISFSSLSLVFQFFIRPQPDRILSSLFNEPLYTRSRIYSYILNLNVNLILIPVLFIYQNIWINHNMK